MKVESVMVVMKLLNGCVSEFACTLFKFNTDFIVVLIYIVQLEMWTEKEFTYDVSYANQTTATVETETSSDDDEDIAGPPMVRELKTGKCIVSRVNNIREKSVKLQVGSRNTL